MRGKFPLYSSVIGLIIFVLIMVGIYSGVKISLYMMVIPLILIFVIYFSFHFLDERFASIIVLISIVIAGQVIFKIWAFTIMLFCYLCIMLFANYVIKNKKWSSVLMNAVSILFIVILFFIVLQKNL